MSIGFIEFIAPIEFIGGGGPTPPVGSNRITAENTDDLITEGSDHLVTED